MSVCPSSCFFEDDFEQICIVEIEILCVKSLVFNASNDVKFYDFDTCQYFFFCHSREHFVSDSHLRVLYKRKLLQVKSNLWFNQDKRIEFYSYSEYMWKIFIQSSTLHK